MELSGGALRERSGDGSEFGDIGGQSVEGLGTITPTIVVVFVRFSSPVDSCISQ
jgi:hypothetical protein